MNNDQQPQSQPQEPEQQFNQQPMPITSPVVRRASTGMPTVSIVLLAVGGFLFIVGGIFGGIIGGFSKFIAFVLFLIGLLVFALSGRKNNK